MKLLARRIQKGHSREQAARRLGVCSNTVWRWEKGLSVPRVSQRRRIREYLKDEFEALVVCERSPAFIKRRWEDPGDYPSNMGGGPLPSTDYLALEDGGEWEIDLSAFLDGIGLSVEEQETVEIGGMVEGEKVSLWLAPK